jgi:LPXTG-site transpeptidase (sortase) family protein
MLLMAYIYKGHMERFIRVVARLVRAAKDIADRKWLFGGVFCVVFIGSVAILARYELLPEAPSPLVVEAPGAVHDAVPPVSELPSHIEIPAIGRVAIVSNPTSTVIADLDKELLKGAVRYPTSAKLGEEGNVILFGHSSYLPIVGNEAYKTFNGIQKLVAGDEVRVSSEGRVYIYRVRNVLRKSAEDDGIPLAVTGKVLTLSTCDSFGKKSDRFVVTADFVESRPVAL